MEGAVGIPMCFHMEKHSGSYVRDDPFNEKNLVLYGCTKEEGVPDNIFRTTVVASCELDTDTLMLLSINHQRRLGIRLDPVTNVAEMWDEFYENWFELELAQTPSGLPVIRTDNYASERYDKIKAIRARGSYLKGQENLTMNTFCYIQAQPEAAQTAVP